MLRICLLPAFLGFVVEAASPRATASPPPQDKKAATASVPKPKPKFTIGKDTTYVAGPLDKDGFIDYAAALNERLRQGVTPATNANVLIWKAIGPRPEGVPLPADFFQWLQIDPPPEQDEYFIGLERFIKEHLKINDPEQADAIRNQQTRASQRPWTAKKYPHIAAWLKINAKPLAVVIDGTKRPHYFAPLVPDKDDKGSKGILLTANLSGVQKSRELTAALAARALLRVAEGRRAEAWQDLLACHRLGRHVGKGATLIEGLVGLAIDHIASAADVAFLESAKLDAKQVRACLRDLQQLPPLPAMADMIDTGERFFFLDGVMLVARGGVDVLEGLAGKGGKARDKAASPIGERFLQSVDWDPALRNGNQWYDRLAAAMRLPDRPAREKLLRQITDDIREMHSKNVSAANAARMILGTSQAKGKALGDILSALLLPAFHRIQHAADRNEQVQRNLHLAFALAAHRHDHGRYPAQLDDLAPKYLPKVEPDLFTGKPLVYRPMDNGYLLYSFGIDGRDNDARGQDDDPPGDDLAVRMPLPRLREP